jgi:hypothetical protein
MVGRLVNNELEGIGKEATLVKCKVLSQNLSGETEKLRKSLVKIAGFRAEASTWNS